MIITLLREWKSAQLIKHHRSWPCCRRTEAIMEIEPVAVGDRALASDREGSGSFIMPKMPMAAIELRYFGGGRG